MPLSRTLRLVLRILLALPALTPLAHAAPVPVVNQQGATHGFLLVRSEAGKMLGFGEYSQLAKGDRVTGRLTLHFKDGSLDDETTIYTQNSVFRLVSDHHIQRGPFFPKPIDMRILANGDVTSRTTGPDGKSKVESSHVDAPADLANGLVYVLLLNVRSTGPKFSLGYLAPRDNGRLIQLDIAPDGQQNFSCVIGFRCKASVFRLKLKLGGLTGLVAPLVGKQPSDIFVWVLEGESPALVREVGQLAEDGPVVSLEMAGAIFTHPPAE